jgi:hypothetical protein
MTAKRLKAPSNGLRHAAVCPATNHAECPTFERLLPAAGTGKLRPATGSPAGRRRSGTQAEPWLALTVALTALPSACRPIAIGMRGGCNRYALAHDPCMASARRQIAKRPTPKDWPKCLNSFGGQGRN